jgi:hypothetical protein
MSALRFALSTLLGSSVTVPAMAQGEPLSVCQMLSSTRERQEVTVRGVITGGHHGYFLNDGRGDETCPGWPKRFFTSPAAVGLAFFSALGVQLTDDQNRLNLDFLRRFGTLRFEHNLNSYRVTVRGVLAKRPWLRTFRHADGTYSCFLAAYDGDCLGVFVLRSIVSEGN